jgi:(1->4)-alpha-D-glucan 1-alpha-D-glucosylmutase
VDYARNRELLSSIKAVEEENRLALVCKLMREPEDDRLKMYLTRSALRFRLNERELFAGGEYIPLTASGARARNIIAFARRLGDREAVVISGRFFTRLCDVTRESPVGAQAWRDTAVGVGGQAGAIYRDVLTGSRFPAVDYNGAGALMLSDALAYLPVALLERVE